jgi:hypothetical protein
MRCAAESGWETTFDESENTYVKILGVTDGEIAVDGKKYHGVIYQGKFHLVEQSKAQTWPLAVELLHQLLGLPAPEKPSPQASSPPASSSSVSVRGVLLLSSNIF